MNDFDWIRDIIPTHYYDNSEEIDGILKKSILELGIPTSFRIELNDDIERQASTLWEESNEMIKTYTENEYEVNDVIKRWRIRYTIELCKELICTYGRHDSLTGGIAPNFMVILERTQENKRHLREELMHYHDVGRWV